MPIELTMLLYSVILTFVVIAVPAVEAILRNGAAMQAGSRDSLPEPSVFHKRASRLQSNMLENMAIFAPLVLIAHTTSLTNDTTALGAQIFFYARIGHAISYWAGWPFVRPLFWFVSVIGLIMIALQLL